MIVKNTSLHPVLVKLEASDFTFYPIGSRYLDVAEPGADYDFLVESKDAKEDLKLKTFLINNDFKMLEDNHAEVAYSADGLLTAVYRWAPREGLPGVDILAGHKEEIQFRRRVFEVLRKRVLYPANKVGYEPISQAFKRFDPSGAVWLQFFTVLKDVVRTEMEHGD